MECPVFVHLDQEQLQALYRFYYSQSRENRLTIATTLFLMNVHLDGINWDESEMNCSFKMEVTKRQ